jgi:hypothetical protein
MTKGSRLFSDKGAVTVYADEQPELYKLAEDALYDDDRTFTYRGRVWQVGGGKPGNYIVIKPEVPNL